MKSKLFKDEHLNKTNFHLCLDRGMTVCNTHILIGPEATRSNGCEPQSRETIRIRERGSKQNGSWRCLFRKALRGPEINVVERFTK
jgi:hypothetical protein